MIVEDDIGSNIRFKCDDCGQFVLFDDILSEAAIHRLVTEETLYSNETFETLCKNCNK